MIYGIGTDIVEISRIEDEIFILICRKNTHQMKIKIASQYKNEKLIKYLAKQFAGKEAISKAFGTGIRKPILMKDIEIIRDEIGKPYLNPLGGVKKTIIRLGYN